MRLAAVILAALLALAAAPPAAALDCPTPYLCFLNGSWAADGTSFGRPSRVTMRWEAVLGGKFARLDYRIETKGQDGRPDQVFEGTGLYRPLKNGTYDGTWFDSQGAMHPLRAIFTGAKLTAHWGVKGKTYGRTTYTMIDHEHVEVVDEIQDKKGAWKEFARNTLTKVE
jgi:hypothetical protein